MEIPRLVLSDWWLVAPGVLLAAAAIGLVTLRHRRLGYLAFLSALAALGLGLLWACSSFGKAGFSLATYRAGRGFVQGILVDADARLDMVKVRVAGTEYSDDDGREIALRRTYPSKFELRMDPASLSPNSPFGDSYNLIPLPRAPGGATPPRASFVDWQLHASAPSRLPHASTRLLDFSVGCRLWLLLIPLSIFPLLWFHRRWRRRSEPKGGHCRCGYDLRAHAVGAPCPECGRPKTVPPTDSKSSTATEAQGKPA